MTTYHLSASVRGMLAWPRSEFKRALKYMTKDDGSHFASIEELRDALMDELARGHEHLKTGPCDNHDWKKGCQGHPDKITPAEPVPPSP
jgi:hypothetical protein